MLQYGLILYRLYATRADDRVFRHLYYVHLHEWNLCKMPP